MKDQASPPEQSLCGWHDDGCDDLIPASFGIAVAVGGEICETLVETYSQCPVKWCRLEIARCANHGGYKAASAGMETHIREEHADGLDAPSPYLSADAFARLYDGGK